MKYSVGDVLQDTIDPNLRYILTAHLGNGVWSADSVGTTAVSKGAKFTEHELDQYIQSGLLTLIKSSTQAVAPAPAHVKVTLPAQGNAPCQFQVGDQFKQISNGWIWTLKGFKLSPVGSPIWEVENNSLGSPYIREYTETHMRNWVAQGLWHKLNTPPVPKYQVGDSFTDNDSGNTFTLKALTGSKTQQSSPIWEINYPFRSSNSVFMASEDELDAWTQGTWHKVGAPNMATTEPATCTCDMRDLMMNGCGCGQLQRERLKRISQ